MNPEQTIAINVRRFRASRGMSVVNTAKAAGISRQALGNIEKGLTKEPRVSNLQALANALDVQIVDLLAVPPKLNTVRFRSNSVKTAKDKAKKEQYLIDAAFWLGDFNFLQDAVCDKKEYKLRNAVKDIGGLKNNRPVKAAELTRLAFDLKEDEPIGDIIGLMENAGIKVKTSKFELKNFFGFSISEPDGGPAIVVNSNRHVTIERQIFTVAHELGHLLLHPQAYNPDKSKENELEEKEADLFAANFLVPKSAFKKKLDESYGLGFVEKIIHVKRFFGVSYQSILHRLTDLGVSDYNSLVIKFSYLYKKKFGKSLAGHVEPNGLEEYDFVEDYLRSLIRKALDKNIITVSRAAEIQNISLIEMREIINSWAEMAA